MNWAKVLGQRLVFSLIIQNQDLRPGTTFVLSRTIFSTALHLRVDTFQHLGCMMLWLLFLHGSRTDDVITVGSRGMKIAFRPEIGACISFSTEGTCIDSNRQLEACTSCSTDDTCRVHRSESTPAGT